MQRGPAAHRRGCPALHPQDTTDRNRTRPWPSPATNSSSDARLQPVLAGPNTSSIRSWPRSWSSLPAPWRRRRISMRRCTICCRRPLRAPAGSSSAAMAMRRAGSRRRSAALAESAVHGEALPAYILQKNIDHCDTRHGVYTEQEMQARHEDPYGKSTAHVSPLKPR